MASRLSLIPFSLLFFFVLVGCSMTRGVPFTDMPPSLQLGKDISKLKVAVVLFDVKDTDISGGHHEGLLQVRQPWIFGLSKEDKEALYSGLPDTVRYSIASEFARQGMKVVVLEGESPEMFYWPDIVINGRVAGIELNTYGHGTIEGFGSAGDYWESTITLDDVAVYGKKDRAVMKIGRLVGYAKLPESPATLSWTMFTLLSKSLKASLNMARASEPLEVAGAVRNTVYTFKGDYILRPKDVTPAEVAARNLAVEIIKRIQNEMR